MITSHLNALMLFTIFLLPACAPNDQKISMDPEAPTRVKRVPVVTSDWWRICEAPDLDSLNGPDPERQHVVDHGFVQAADGTWQLWACMRGTKVGRLLFGWEGKSLESGPWEPIGITARAQEEYGERVGNAESIQAPYFDKIGDTYYMFYNSNGIRLMTSQDGKTYERKDMGNGNNILYEKGGRDVMVMRDEDTYYAYSTVSQVSGDGWGKGSVILRTSKDLKKWGDYTIVSEGGIGGNGVVSAESPFVIKIDGYYYLFRSSSITLDCYVYRSETPFNFGVNNDEKLVAVLSIKAPEIILNQGQYYISDLADWKGIKLAKLSWELEDSDHDTER